MVLNKEQFETLGGNPQKWDAEFDNFDKETQNLNDIYADQIKRGRIVATLHSMSEGYGVHVDAFWLLEEYNPNHVKPQCEEWIAKNETILEAIIKGKAWSNADPDNREFVAKKRDVLA